MSTDLTPVEKARLELGLKPSEFARKLGGNRQHVAEVRSGKRPLSIRMALKLEALTGRSGFVEEAARRLRGA